MKEVIDLAEKELGLETLYVKTGEGNTEFIFRRKGASNWWDDVVAQRRYVPLVSDFRHEAGQMYSVHLPELTFMSDAPGNERRSSLTLLEDGRPLYYRHALLPGIEKYGEGRFRHWEDRLFFSSSDLSNPQNNGRRYGYWLEE